MTTESDATPAPKVTQARYNHLLGAFLALPPRTGALPDDEPEAPMSVRAAGLLLAHLIVEQGASRVAKMKVDEVTAWAAAFRARYMLAWSSVLHEDPMGFQHQLEIMRVLHDTVAGYQQAMDELTSTAPVADPRRRPKAP